MSDRSGAGGLQFGFSSTSVTVKEEAEVYFYHYSQAQVQVHFRSIQSYLKTKDLELELNPKFGLDLEGDMEGGFKGVLEGRATYLNL